VSAAGYALAREVLVATYDDSAGELRASAATAAERTLVRGEAPVSAMRVSLVNRASVAVRMHLSARPAEPTLCKSGLASSLTRRYSNMEGEHRVTRIREHRVRYSKAVLVAIGSMNPVKINSARRAFELTWPDESWVFTGRTVESGVSRQPLTDAETIKGARNRSIAALEQLGADYGVGIEGGLQRTGDKWFAGVWVAVIDKQGKEGVGGALKVTVPTNVMQLVQGGLELGEACDQAFNTRNSKQNEGIFGLVTNGLLSRTIVSTEAVIAALAAFRLLPSEK
jgi:inosine/xanthosine triphosphatase